MKDAVAEYLDIKKDGFYIDATAGYGYLAEVILGKLSAAGRILMVDCDSEVLEITKKKEVFRDARVIIENGSYTELPAIVSRLGPGKTDGILFDFGIGTHQLNSARGFSFRKDEPLDMRYSRNNTMTASEVVNKFPEKELADIIYKFGEEHRSRRIASAIVRARVKEPIETTLRLADIVRSAVKSPRLRRHPATKTFQALRIYVNRELDNVASVFGFLPELLSPGGRAVFLSYHSLEDRIVKNSLKSMEKEGLLEILTKKPLTASVEEIKSQPRSRAARLRAVRMP